MPPILRKLSKAAPHAAVALARAARGKEFAFSFNIADRCPVGCDCYWRATSRVPELEDRAVLEFFEARRAEGFQLVTIVGGEPYVRRDLLPKVTPIMPANWLVTSGTTPLLRLPKTTHFVSIDGQDADTHDRVRRMPGLYSRILRNLEKARADGEFPVFIHSVLNGMNYSQARQILRTWRENGLADGVLFSTFTRIGEGSDNGLTLTRDQRAQIADELPRLKAEFRDFLAMSPAMIRHASPAVIEAQSSATCGTSRFIASYYANGARMRQCIFSEKGDCAECGCVVTSIIDTLLDVSTMGVMARLYTP